MKENYKVSPNPVDISNFDKFFLKTDIAQRMIFRFKQSKIIHKPTMDIYRGYDYIEKFLSGINWYMVESEDFFSNIIFKLKYENGNLESFNAQKITLR